MDRIKFYVNGNKYTVGSEVDSDVYLLEYVREYLGYSGTKFMCKEGGCGACVVAVTAKDPYTGHPRTFSVNSCLIAVTQCHEWSIKTVDGIGNRRAGYHPVQKTLAEYNGTQCGYCSPGFVMSMYSFLESRHYDVTEREVEDAFGSNVCRCTGYRPILQAFRSFAKDSPKPHPVHDIEDLPRCKKGENCQETCNRKTDWCLLDKNELTNDIIKIVLKDNRLWYRVNTVNDIFNILNKEGYNSYRLVVGNTGKGVVPILSLPRVLIDIANVWELKRYYLDVNLVLGAAMTLTDVMDVFLKLSETNANFEYLRKLYDHLNLVAHIPVRNVGSIAGNLMTKHTYPEFPSDVFLLFEAVGAVLTIESKNGTIIEVYPEDFLKIDMTDKVIVNAKLPPRSQSCNFFSFKVMPRAQSAHAQVNAAFLYEFSEHTELLVSARIVITGLSGCFARARETEEFLKGKYIFNNETLQHALKILDNELIVEEIPGEEKAVFRRKLALGLFYKGYLSFAPEMRVNPRYRSGTRDFRKTRPLSRATDVEDTNPVIWPITKPYPKVEALIQCSGEAKYISDMPNNKQEVFAAFVTSDVCRGTIESIDPTPALKIPGVLQFFSAKDIPGNNSFLSQRIPSLFVPEEILCSGEVQYYDQPIGIIVAESQRLAERASLIVQVKYKVQKKDPILTINDVRTRDPSRSTLFLAVPARDRGVDVQRIIKGRQNIYYQSHMTMETLTAIAIPENEGITVFPSTQWLDATQVSVADALKVPENRIDVSLTRVGGAYGLKISRTNLVSCASALVAHLLNRPCRFVFSVQATLRILGKRPPVTRDFEVGVNSEGEVQYLEYQFYEDNGFVFSDQMIILASTSYKNCYDIRRWQSKFFNVTTDTASNTWARAPGSLEAIAMAEYLMEQISYAIDRDPIEVRRRNFNAETPIVEEILTELMNEAEYKKRKEEVATFNKVNRWKKRGLRVSLMNFAASIVNDYQVLLSVNHGDGTVSIRHGGVEIGQGVNTKVIQVVAYTLNISTDFIVIKGNDSVSNVNTVTTGDSRTTENVSFGAIKCCQLLLDRLNVVREELNDEKWQLLVQAAYYRGINLQTSYHTTSNDSDIFKIAGVSLSEVEVDILTGEHEILRVDIIEDVGLSVNPELDLGQVEGSFIMGVGYWTSESIIYDEKTGEILTDRTWNYHVPCSKDIPQDFRVKFRRNSYEPRAALGAKSCSEPPLCLAISVPFAIREAISSSREETGFPRTEWFNIDGPHTLEQIVLAADVKLEEFLLE